MLKYYKFIQKGKLDFKQHQYDGVKWCLIHELKPSKTFNGFKGGIIADEMGLGKTILMIAIMYVNLLPNTLIIVPPILIQQWNNLIYKITGHKPLLYYGKNKNDNVASLQYAPIVLTTYHTLCTFSNPIFNIQWSRIIFDEGHHLRNANTHIFKYNKILYLLTMNKEFPIYELKIGRAHV